MAYEIQIMRRDVSGYTEEGEPIDGDVRLIRDHGTDTELYDPEFDRPVCECIECPFHNPDAEDLSSDECFCPHCPVHTPDRQFDHHVAWAVERILRTDAYIPSSYPVPAELAEREWLSGTWEHPAEQWQAETSVYLTGHWAPAERAEVFRRVYASAMGH